MKEGCTSTYGEEAINFAKSIKEERDLIYSGTDRACRAYNDFMDNLDFRIGVTFQFVSRNSKTRADIVEARDCWLSVVSLVDEILSLLKDMQDNLPECAQSADFNFLLDYRSEAKERADFLQTEAHAE